MQSIFIYQLGQADCVPNPVVHRISCKTRICMIRFHICTPYRLADKGRRVKFQATDSGFSLMQR